MFIVRLSAHDEVCNLYSSPFTLHRQAVPFGTLNTVEPLRAGSFASGPTLVGVDYDRSVPDVVRVYLHWRGAVAEGWQARVRSAGGIEATLLASDAGKVRVRKPLAPAKSPAPAAPVRVHIPPMPAAIIPPAPQHAPLMEV